MFDGLLGYLITFALGALSLWLYQTFGGKKSATNNVGASGLNGAAPANPLMRFNRKPTSTASPKSSTIGDPVTIPKVEDKLKEEREKEEKDVAKKETPPTAQKSELALAKEAIVPIAGESHSAPSSPATASPMSSPSTSSDRVEIKPRPVPAHVRPKSPLSHLQPQNHNRHVSDGALVFPANLTGAPPGHLSHHVQPNAHRSMQIQRSNTTVVERTQRSVLRSFDPAKERAIEHRRGWLEIRSLKKFNRRYFILHSSVDGNWLSYFRDNTMMRAECYGHMLLTSGCIVEPLDKAGSAFIVRHKDRFPIFSSRGPFGLNAASTHRVFHGTSAKAVFRADDNRSMLKWVDKIRACCSDTAFLMGQVLPETPPSARDHTVSNTLLDSVALRDYEQHVDSDSAGIEDEYGGEIGESDGGVRQDDEGDKESDFSEGAEDNKLPFEEAQRMYNWPENELAAVIALREEARDLLRQNGCENDYHTMWRFLKARAFNVHAAKDMLTMYFEWREAYRPDEITLADVQSDVEKQFIHFSGYDAVGRPLMIVYAGKFNPKVTNAEDLIRFTCFMIETAIKHTQPPIQSYSLIVDMTNFGMSSMDLTLAKEAAAIFQAAYPERLGVLTCVNCPLVINMMWRMVKPLLDDRTKAKINFMKNPRDLFKQGSVFPIENVPTSLGGQSTFVCPIDSVGEDTL